MVARLVYGKAEKLAFSERERLIILEIGRDRIDSASSFVEYIASEYSISRSSVWYSLNSLKEKGIVHCADRFSMGEPLILTGIGLTVLPDIESTHESTNATHSMILLNRNGPLVR